MSRLAPHSRRGRSLPGTLTLQRSAFTLIEVIIGTSLLLLTTGLILSFFTQVSFSSLLSDEKNRSNQEIRRFTNELTHHARQANYFLLYRSFASEDRGSAAQRLGHGQSGDFLLLVYLDQHGSIAQLIGYVHTDSANGSVVRFDITPSTTNNTISIEQLLVSLHDQTTFTTLMQNTSSKKEHLFHNLQQQSILVSGERNFRSRGRKLAAVYSFTITPRG